MKKVKPSLGLTAKKDFGAGTGCNNFNLGIDEARDILTHFVHKFVAGTQVSTASDLQVAFTVQGWRQTIQLWTPMGMLNAF